MPPPLELLKRRTARANVVEGLWSELSIAEAYDALPYTAMQACFRPCSSRSLACRSLSNLADCMFSPSCLLQEGFEGDFHFQGLSFSSLQFAWLSFGADAGRSTCLSQTGRSPARRSPCDSAPALPVAPARVFDSGYELIVKLNEQCDSCAGVPQLRIRGNQRETQSSTPGYG